MCGLLQYPSVICNVNDEQSLHENRKIVMYEGQRQEKNAEFFQMWSPVRSPDFQCRCSPSPNIVQN